jgi:hypothetical protein
METDKLYRRIRYLLLFFIAALVVSGVTAIPLTWESALLNRLLGKGTIVFTVLPAFAEWIAFVDQGLQSVSRDYPFIRYGTDWLAFAHIMIAVVFLGPLRDPVKNIWVVEFGMIACVLIVPTALIFGALRGIPPFWQVLDCSFGIFGIVPLYLVRRDTRRLIAHESATQLNRSRELLQART